MEYKHIAENYKDRIGRIALFEPLYELGRKKGKDLEDKAIDYFGLGILTLLFFFENMLVRKRSQGIRQLSLFLEQNCHHEIAETSEGFYKIALTIMEVFRPTSGKRNSKIFYNWETNNQDEVFYSLFKTEGWNKETKEQFYTLDTAGLDLIFATKEYFSEFHLSINQLVLRKQLEKGEFIGALRQVDEMRIDVNKIKDRMSQIKQDIKRNIVSEETYEKYKQVIEDVHSRLSRENEEFEELKLFIKETKERLENELTTEKEIKTYDLIIKVDYGLGKVHQEHTKLLNESIILKTTALEAARESLYYVGINAFNFDVDIVSQFTSIPLDISLSRPIVNPFLRLEQADLWSPMTVFGKQRIPRNERTQVQEVFPKKDSSHEAEHLVSYHIWSNLIDKLLAYMNGVDSCTITLQGIMGKLQEEESQLLQHRMVYDFFMILHQYSPFKFNIISEEADHEKNFRQFIEEKLGNIFKTMIVEELTDTISIYNRFIIKDMEIRWECR